MDWITDQIALGNFLDAARVRPGDVDAILCLRPGCACEERDDIDVEFVPLKDGSGNSAADIHEAFDFLRTSVAGNERVFVHCHAGRSRSVCLVAAWLMAERGMDRTESLAYIEARRTGGIWLSPGVEEIFGLLKHPPR